jgi:hypothetical protein
MELAWTAVNSMNTARGNLGYMGTQTAALIIGGQTPPGVNNVEEYDGISWAATTNLPTTRFSSSAVGTVSSGVHFGGSVPPNTTATDIWTGAGTPNTVTITAS